MTGFSVIETVRVYVGGLEEYQNISICRASGKTLAEAKEIAAELPRRNMSCIRTVGVEVLADPV